MILESQRVNKQNTFRSGDITSLAETPTLPPTKRPPSLAPLQAPAVPKLRPGVSSRILGAFLAQCPIPNLLLRQFNSPPLPWKLIELSPPLPPDPEYGEGSGYSGLAYSEHALLNVYCDCIAQVTVVSPVRSPTRQETESERDSTRDAGGMVESIVEM